MPKLALFDLDGTLSNDDHRQHLYQQQQWADYFSYDAQMADPVWPEGRALYEEMILDGWDIGYLTARRERNRQASVDWLTLHEFVNPDSVILRPEADANIRPPKFKAIVVEDFIKHSLYDAVVLIDNDPLVVERIRADLGEEFVFHARWGSRESFRHLEV